MSLCALWSSFKYRKCQSAIIKEFYSVAVVLQGCVTVTIISEHFVKISLAYCFGLDEIVPFVIKMAGVFIFTVCVCVYDALLVNVLSQEGKLGRISYLVFGNHVGLVGVNDQVGS